MAQACKGVTLQAAGGLVASCILLSLLLWRCGIIPHSARVRESSHGVCSTAQGDMVVGDDSNRIVPQPHKPPHMIVYAHNCCAKSSIKACSSALRHGFGSCGQFGLQDLNLALLSPEGRSILTEEGSRGAGWWLWKPMIILQELLRAEEGDILVYMDADSEIMSDVAPVLQLLDNQDVAGFSSFTTEANTTKTDVLLLLNATHLKDTRQLYAGLILLRRTWHSIGFVSQWLTYVQDRRWVTDMANTLLPSVLQGRDHPGFMMHCHDQAIFSLLYKKYGFKVWPDPTAHPNDTVAYNHPFPGFWVWHHTEEAANKL